MDLVARITIVGDKGNVAPGESFTLANKEEAAYLIERGLASEVKSEQEEPEKTTSAKPKTTTRKEKVEA